MSIEILQTVASMSWCFYEGQIVDAPDELAQKLISEGFAVACPETNATKPQRNAAKPKPQFRRG